MNITLYISNYDKTDIVKTFVAAKTWAFTNGQLRYPTNVLNPIIRVDFRDVLCSSIGDVQFENQSSDTVVYYGTFTSYKYRVTYLDGSGDIIE